MEIKTLLKLAGYAVLTIVVIIGALNLLTILPADKVMYVQYPWGTLRLVTEQGPTMQAWGKVTMYSKRGQFWFSSKEDQGRAIDDAIKVRFNDGANGAISGSLSYELPIGDEKAMRELHTLYGSEQAIVHELIRTVVEKSVYFAGPLMSSREAFAEKRNDLIRYIDDQVVNGVYKTTTKNIQDKDPMTGAPRTVAITEIVMGKVGPERQDESPIVRFKIKIYNLSLNSITYEERVENQIQAQQTALQQVQTAIAKAKEAEQGAITAAKEGEAKAATAKWEQEVIKARAVTEAQQKLEVARLDAAAAAQYKQKQILEGEGESAKRRLVMFADGALTQKLEAYKFVQEQWAKAWAQNGAQVVPSIVSGGAAGATNGLEAFLGLQNLRALKDLGLTMDMKKSAGQAQE
jgi:regulator of protease activity HflC (stomatin/prohibitin superfamily)